jgi:hypothetical protein
VSDIVRGLTRDDNADSIIRETGSRAKSVIDRILSSGCAASAYLTSEDKAALIALAENLAVVRFRPSAFGH